MTREGMYCEKCKVKTPHHFFMPVGMVCNVCGDLYRVQGTLTSTGTITIGGQAAQNTKLVKER